MDVDDDGNTPVKSKKPPRPNESASDQDFSEAGDTEGDEESEQNGAIDPRELETGRARSQGTRKKVQQRSTPKKSIPIPQQAQPKVKGKAKSTTVLNSSKPSVVKQQGSVPATAKNATKSKSTIPSINTAKKHNSSASAQKDGGVGKLPTDSAKVVKKKLPSAMKPDGSIKTPGIDKVHKSGGQKVTSAKSSAALKTSEVQQEVQKQAQTARSSTQDHVVVKHKSAKHLQHANNSSQQITKTDLAPTMKTPMGTQTLPGAKSRPSPIPNHTAATVSPGKAHSTRTSLPDQSLRMETPTEIASPLENLINHDIQTKVPLSLPPSVAKSQGQISASDMPINQSVQPHPTKASLVMADTPADQTSPRKAPNPITFQVNPSTGTGTQTKKSVDLPPTKKRKITADRPL